jgi:hypothetical protein
LERFWTEGRAEEKEAEMTKYRHMKPPLESQAPQGDPSRICSVTGKRMYANEREAKSTAAHRLADKETGPPQLKIYKCQYCDCWHLSSKA